MDVGPNMLGSAFNIGVYAVLALVAVVALAVWLGGCAVPATNCFGAPCPTPFAAAHAALAELPKGDSQ